MGSKMSYSDESKLVVVTLEEFEGELSNILFVTAGDSDKALILNNGNTLVSVTNIDVDYKNKTLKCNLSTSNESFMVSINDSILALEDKSKEKELITFDYGVEKISYSEDIDSILIMLLDGFLELSGGSRYNEEDYVL